MSKAACETGVMKKQARYCPVILEPELEQETALFTVHQRRALAQKFRRWARQLDVSAFIMLRNQLAGEAKPPCIKAVPAQVLAHN
jgi:hypothetical protein